MNLSVNTLWYYYIRGTDMIYSDITITRILETTYTYAR